MSRLPYKINARPSGYSSSVADAIGRTAISPAQIPAGLVVALLGAPYFVFLLARSRA